jgi:hypothetical protein
MVPGSANLLPVAKHLVGRCKRWAATSSTGRSGIPRAAATGVLIARGQLERTDTLFLHSAPDVLTVEVSDNEGRRLAYGAELERTQDSPMCKLRRVGTSISREDIWPGADDLGTSVILPGGDVGTLKSWWNAEDLMEWRWQVEFCNSRR